MNSKCFHADSGRLAQRTKWTKLFDWLHACKRIYTRESWQTDRQRRSMMRVKGKESERESERDVQNRQTANTRRSHHHHHHYTQTHAHKETQTACTLACNRHILKFKSRVIFQGEIHAIKINNMHTQKLITPEKKNRTFNWSDRGPNMWYVHTHNK